MSYFPTNPLDYIAAVWTDPNGVEWLYSEVKGFWFRNRVAAPAGTGTGDVTGPASSTDGHLAVFDGTDGKEIKSGGAVPTAFPGFGTTNTTAARGNQDITAFTSTAGVNSMFRWDPVLEVMESRTEAEVLSDIGAATAAQGTVVDNATSSGSASTLVKRGTDGYTGLFGLNLETTGQIANVVLLKDAGQNVGTQQVVFPNTATSPLRVCYTANASGYPDALVAGTISGYTENPVAITGITTAHTLNISAGTFQTATLAASTACVFTMPAVGAGKSFVLLLKQEATTGNGSASFIMPGGGTTPIKWPGGTAPVITATAAKMDLLAFASDGTNWYGNFIQNYTP